MASSTEHEPRARHQTRAATASGWIGSALEYYDFFIYATAASLIFPQIFFPKGDPKTAIVASLATYGVGYIARPIGAFVLGHLGDTHGRKQVLLTCMFLMGFSTMAVGLLPTYQQVGLLAPVLLVLLRLIQGFAVAGEISGASSMILEHAPFGRRGFYSSFTLHGADERDRSGRHHLRRRPVPTIFQWWSARSRWQSRWSRHWPPGAPAKPTASTSTIWAIPLRHRSPSATTTRCGRASWRASGRRRRPDVPGRSGDGEPVARRRGVLRAAGASARPRYCAPLKRMAWV